MAITRTTTYNGKQVETIDVTPTWSGLLGYMLTVLADGNEEGKRLIKEEFKRMAMAADQANTLLKSLKELHTVVMLSNDKLIFDNGANANIVANAKEAILKVIDEG